MEDEFQWYVRQLEDFPLDRLEESSAAHDQPFAFLAHLDARDVLRLLLDRVPDATVVVLDLSEPTDCCVEMIRSNWSPSRRGKSNYSLWRWTRR